MASNRNAAVSTPTRSRDSESISKEAKARIEELIQRYKVRRSLEGTPKPQEKTGHPYSIDMGCRSSKYRERDHDNLEDEVDEWDKVNESLVQHGYTPITIHDDDKKNGCVVLDNRNSSILQHTLMSIMEDIDEKNNIISDLRSRHEERELANLQYNNAKLKVDVTNRPDLAEFEKCQERVRELEDQMTQAKTIIASEQLDLQNTQHQLKSIGVLLEVPSVTDIIPEIASLQQQLHQLNNIQGHLQSIVQLVSSSILMHQPLPGHSDLLCPTLWSNVRERLLQWRDYLDGLKEIQVLMFKLNDTLKKEDDKRFPPLSTSSHTVLTAREMADLIKHWISVKKHAKLATTGSLLAMVHHYQELFDVRTLDGVYTSMSRVYNKLNETSLAYKTLVDCLGLRHHQHDAAKAPSWQNVVSAVQRIVATKESQFMLKVHQKFSHLSNDDILDQLTLAREFFPSFHKLIVELQSILGVQSLSAIIPAVRRLTINT